MRGSDRATASLLCRVAAETVSPVIEVVKLAGVRVALNVALLSVSSTIAPFRSPSPTDDGVTAAMAADTTGGDFSYETAVAKQETLPAVSITPP